MERLTETRIDPRDTSFTERQEVHYTVKKEKKFKAFDKLGKLENLEEQVGCPLEVRIQLNTDTIIYTDWGKMKIITLSKKFFRAVRLGFCPTHDPEFMFAYKDYKDGWWLKADRSE